MLYNVLKLCIQKSDNNETVRVFLKYFIIMITIPLFVQFFLQMSNNFIVLFTDEINILEIDNLNDDYVRAYLDLFKRNLKIFASQALRH